MRSTLRAVAVVGAVAFFTACQSDAPSDPKPVRRAPEAPSALLLSSPKTVNVLQRTTPLANPVTASATVGIFGGVLALPSAGLTVIIPPMAVTRTTTLSVTALPGSNVAYEFSPHGTTFGVPLIATQSLNGTNTSGLNIGLFFAGYYQSPADLGSGVATITEILNAGVSLPLQTVTFGIRHFSGYIVATGCEGDGAAQ